MEKKTRKKPNGGRKSNEIDYEKRLPELMKMMLIEKLSYTEFVKKAAQTFDVTQRTSGAWWTEIRNRLKNRYEQESEDVINEQIFRYFNLYEVALSRGSSRVCREILADLNNLYGINKAAKVDVTTDGEPIKINIILDNK